MVVVVANSTLVFLLVVVLAHSQLIFALLQLEGYSMFKRQKIHLINEEWLSEGEQIALKIPIIYTSSSSCKY